MAKKEKRFTWIQLGEKFFQKKKIKKLKRLDRGSTYCLIYIEMLSASLKEDGYLIYEGVEDSFAEELALELDEEVEDVEETINFLMDNKLMVEEENQEDYTAYYLPETEELTGGESASAKRVRRFRAKKEEKEKKEKLENEPPLQCNANVTQCNANVTERNVDVTQSKSKSKSKEKEKELDIDIDIELDSRDREEENNLNYYAIKNYLLKELLFKESTVKEILKLVEAEDLSLKYVKEKAELTEYCTKGGILKNSGYFYKALKENYASIEKRKAWEKSKGKKITKFANFTESSRRDYTDQELNSFISNVKFKNN